MASENRFTDAQLSALVTAYKTLERVDPAQIAFHDLRGLLDRLTQSQIKQLADAKIKFISKLAQNRLISINPRRRAPKARRAMRPSAASGAALVAHARGVMAKRKVKKQVPRFRVIESVTKSGNAFFTFKRVYGTKNPKRAKHKAAARENYVELRDQKGRVYGRFHNTHTTVKDLKTFARIIAQQHGVAVSAHRVKR